MSAKDKFTISFSPITANQFQKNGMQLNRSWADHILGKTIKQIIPVLTESISKNRETSKAMTDKTPRDEAIAVIDMLLSRHHKLIADGVYTNNLTCAEQRAMRS